MCSCCVTGLSHPFEIGLCATGIFANIYCQSGIDSQVELSCRHFTCSHRMYKTEEDLPIFSKCYCSYISTVSVTLLPDVQFPQYSSCAMLFDTVFHLHPLLHSRDFFFTYYYKKNTWYSTIQFTPEHQYLCISCT